MLKIGIMSQGEIKALLLRAGYGHLGCTRDGHPYVVPMHYAYDGQDLYFLTTEGTKTEYIAANAEVCFQVEEVTDASNWRSVMLLGIARRVNTPEEMERALGLITERNPTLSPALSKTDIGAWHRPSKIAVYRVEINSAYGRKTE